MVMLEYGIVPGIVAGVLVGSGAGYLNGLIVTRLDVNPFIATLGTMVMLRGATFLITGGRPVVGEYGLPVAFTDFATDRVFGIPLLVLFPIAVFVVFHWLLHRTAFGLRLFATGGNTAATRLLCCPAHRPRSVAVLAARGECRGP